MLRATFVSINLFSLVCSGNEHVSGSSTNHLSRYGGPLLYLVLTIPILLAVLVWYDSGSKRYHLSCRSRSRQAHIKDENPDYSPKEDVVSEAQAVAHSDDQLRVLHVNKSFGRTKVIDDVSLGVSTNTG
jgi:ATP-binding cassette subfamily A (ABC1) protein 3